jgi:hypothetical protein
MTIEKHRYRFTVSVDFDVPFNTELQEEPQFCCAGEQGYSGGSCGDDCAQYFWMRLENWMNHYDKTAKVIYAEIERLDDECI